MPLSVCFVLLLVLLAVVFPPRASEAVKLGSLNPIGGRPNTGFVATTAETKRMARKQQAEDGSALRELKETVRKQAAEI